MICTSCHSICHPASPRESETEIKRVTWRPTRLHVQPDGKLALIDGPFEESTWAVRDRERSSQEDSSPHLGRKGTPIIRRSGSDISQYRDICELCTLMWASICQRRDLEDYGEADVEIQLLPEDPFDGSKVIKLEITAQDGSFVGYRLLDLISVEDVGSKIIASNLPTSTSLGQSLQMVERCLEICLADHQSCNQDFDHGWLPTRLIDLGPLSSKCVPKLVESSEFTHTQGNMEFRYFTLSHKWGKSEFVKLTSENLQDLKTAIPITGLSRTFIDAIRFTRRLRIQYLWIDSLCIIQDSAEDWRLEASRMNLVYKNCLCNLAASDADGPDQGFFKERDTVLVEPVVLEFKTELLNGTFLCFFDGWSDLLRETPLSTRGWVIQEHLLSPRTVHFSNQIFWECREQEACEIYPSGRPDAPVVPRKIWRDLPDAGTAINRWRSAVGAYSECLLSKAEDKLVAVSGIAKALQPILEDEYLAGIWRHDIICGLLWIIRKDLNGEETKADRPQVYRAPSWSWASIDGKVYPYLLEHDFTPLIQVTDAKVVPLADDSYGQIIDGHIDFIGRIFSIPDIDAVLDDRWQKRDFDPWSFCLDDWKYLDGPLSFVPLADTSATNDGEFPVFGLLLSVIDVENTVWACRRVGVAAVSKRGDVAGTGFELPGWVPLPWPDNVLCTKFRLV